MFWNLVKAQFALCVLFFWPFFDRDPFWKPKELLFIGLSLMIVMVGLVGRNGLGFQNRRLAAIGIYVTGLFSWHFLGSFLTDTLTIRFWTLLPSLNVILSILLIVVLVRCTASMEEWVSFTKWMCLVSGIVAGYSILQYLGFDNMKYSIAHSNPIFSTFGNSFLTAEFLAVTAPFFLVFKGWPFRIGIAACGLVVLLCNSLGASLAFIVGVSTFLFMCRRWKAATAFIGLIFLGVWWVSPTNSIHWFDPLRWALWKETITGIKEAAIFGHGLGSFVLGDWISSITSSRTHAAHNDFLQFWYEGGIILLILLGIYFKDLLRRLIQCEGSVLVYAYLASLAAFSVNMMVGFPCRIAGIAIVAVVSIAFLEVYSNERT